MTTEQIEAAVDEGIRQYWADNELQSQAFAEWKAAGFAGKCRQHAEGSLADYVKRALRQAEVGRETVAAWMMERSYATGHGDTIEDLLVELEGHARDRGARERKS